MSPSQARGKARRTWRTHWVIVAALFLFIGIDLGLANDLYSIFLIPVTENLNISRGVFATARSLNGLVYLLSTVTFVPLYRRYGFRVPAVVFTLLTALGYVGYAVADNMIPFYLGAVLFGVGEAFQNTAGAAQLLNNWFRSNRGKIMGVVMSATGLGGAVLSVVLSAIIEGAGWRAAFWVSAGLLAIAALIALVVFRDHPEECGLEPYGAEEDAPSKKRNARAHIEWEGVPGKQLLREPIYYVAAVTTLVCSVCAYSSFSTFAAHLQDQGLAPSVAASCYSVLLFGLAGAKVLMGAFSDRYGANAAMMICMVCGIAGMFLMINVTTLWQAIVSATLLAVFTCTIGFMQPLMAWDIFGSKGYNMALSTLVSVMSVGNMISGPLVNTAHDMSGSYRPILTVMGFVTIGVTLMVVLIIAMTRSFRRRVWDTQAVERAAQ